MEALKITGGNRGHLGPDSRAPAFVAPDARILGLIMASILVQMLFQPWFNDLLAGLLSVDVENRQILVLISAMPAAITWPVFAARYDCAAKTATLTFTHIVLSPVVVPTVFALLS